MSSTGSILDARVPAGLSQSELARHTSLPEPHPSAYEAGRVQPRPEALARIAAATVSS